MEKIKKDGPGRKTIDGEKRKNGITIFVTDTMFKYIESVQKRTGLTKTDLITQSIKIADETFKNK